MMSASMISTGAARVAAMLSPAKNPCRIRVKNLSAPSTVSAAAPVSWYRHDPYMSKVLSSPMKTQVSPSAPETPKHVNSLFAAPAQPKPRSFLDAAVVPSAATQAPVAPRPAAESAKAHFAIIHFKHDSATFIAPFRVQVGDRVIVEGDRGEDLGRIVEITTVTPSYPVPLKIIRRAAPRDLEKFDQKLAKEMQTVTAVQKLAQQLNLPIEVVDTEFQFDSNKLTVFFHANSGHTDFRKLQRGLFREHRCRIWLSNMAEVDYNAQLQKTRRTR